MTSLLGRTDGAVAARFQLRGHHRGLRFPIALGDPPGIKARTIQPRKRQAPSESGVQHSQRHQGHRIALGLHQRFQNTANARAARDWAGNLRNGKRRELQILMMLALADEALGRLLGRHNADIGDEAAMNCVRVIEIDGVSHEIRTVRPSDRGTR